VTVEMMHLRLLSTQTLVSELLNQTQVSEVKSVAGSVLRASGATPLERRGSMHAPEGPDDVDRVVADTAAELSDGAICLGEQPRRPGHLLQEIVGVLQRRAPVAACPYLRAKLAV
jgi:hypothetical protein